MIGESLHPCSENGTQNPTGGIMQVDMVINYIIMVVVSVLHESFMAQSPLEGLKQVSPGNVNVTLRRGLC